MKRRILDGRLDVGLDDPFVRTEGQVLSSLDELPEFDVDPDDKLEDSDRAEDDDDRDGVL